MSHITLQDIAKKAGVTTTTISRALNNKPDVSPKTKEKILKIAKNLGYTPNLLAKSLRSRKSKTIGREGFLKKNWILQLSLPLAIFLLWE